MDPETVPTYGARVLSVRAADPVSNDDLMRLCRQRAADPSVFDDFTPQFFSGEISSTRWDAYDTRMLPSTLRNFATEAGQGVAVLLNHDPTREPVGQSLTGRFVGGSGDGVARVESDFFVLPLPDVAEAVTRMRAGVRRDQSVGFYGGTWNCTLCGRDMMQWLSRDGCPHILGMVYQPQDEAGQPAGQLAKARAEIDGGHLAEYSSVYDGATPGAMLGKARWLAGEGLLRGAERERVEVRYRAAVAEAPRGFRGIDLPDGGQGTPAPSGEETDMAETHDTGGSPTAVEVIHLADGRALNINDVQALDALRQRTVDALTAARFPGDTVEQRLERLGTDLPRLRALAAPLESLTPPTDEADPDTWRVAEFGRLRRLADDGRTYRADLIEQALTEGVRAFGNEFPREQEKADLEGASLETIKRRRDQWAASAKAALGGGGRVTTDGGAEGAPKPPRVPSFPASAYS